MAKVIKLDKFTGKIIRDGIGRAFKSKRQMFMSLGVMIDRDTQLTFRGQGSYQDRPRWPTWNKGKGHVYGGTTRTKLGTWNIRYGTDKNPKRTAKELAEWKTKHNLWYKPGPMKGYKKDRRYSGNSKLLQAGGEFKRSFRIIKVMKNRLIYGTKHPLAEKIMSNPTRQALWYTSRDRTRYGSLIYQWIRKGIKF